MSRQRACEKKSITGSEICLSVSKTGPSNIASDASASLRFPVIQETVKLMYSYARSHGRKPLPLVTLSCCSFDTGFVTV